MNLNTLIDQWIGEEIPNRDEQGEIISLTIEGLNTVRKDLKSRKQELIEGIVNTIIAELEKCKDDENIWDYIYALKK